MARKLAAALTLAVFLLLVALGVWQVQRLGWKRALIAQTERRLAAAPVPAPGPAAWPRVTRDDVYTRVTVTGRYRVGADTFTQAVTEFGGGFWVMTPLVTDRFTVLVNRGFVPPDRRNAVAAPAGPVTVTGLLRITEPKGGFLRSNDPAAGRWYSRDIAAIAAARGLGRVAPYFIDAARAPGAPADTLPRAGLTVVSFPNNHLVYALTWFGMAALLAFMAIRAVRSRSQR